MWLLHQSINTQYNPSIIVKCMEARSRGRAENLGVLCPDSWQPALSAFQGVQEVATAATRRRVLCIRLDVYTRLSVSDRVSQGLRPSGVRAPVRNRQHASGFCADSPSLCCQSFSCSIRCAAASPAWMGLEDDPVLLAVGVCAHARAMCVLLRFQPSTQESASALLKHAEAV